VFSIDKLRSVSLHIVSTVPSFGVVLALLALVGFAFGATEELWGHMAQYVLFPAIWNSVSIALTTVLACLCLGVALAWVVVFVDFPGRTFFYGALALPLAFPAYVLAFVAIGALDYSGPLMTAIRTMTGFDLSGLLPIRSRVGMVMVLAVAFYPYVFLMAREAFRSQGRRLFEAARSLGCPPLQSIRRLSLPLARPWIFAGLSLVLMESLADFGVAAAFNVDTLTLAVYKVWFGMFSLAHAAQLALIHLCIVGLLLWGMKRLSKENARYEDQAAGVEVPWRWSPPKWGRWLVFIGVGGFWLVAFFAPLLQLVIWSWQTVTESMDLRLWGWARNSFVMSSLTAAGVCVFSFLISYLNRLTRSPGFFRFARLASLGYAFPGTVLAIAFTVLFTLFFGPLGLYTGLALVAMLLALMVRFFAVGFNPIYHALKRIPPSVDEAAYSLGASGRNVFQRVHFPLVSGSVGGAFLFVFMDCLKEMPIHVMMRPFGWDSLAVRIFEFTNEGEWQRAALPALLIVMISFPAVVWLSHRAGRREYKRVVE